MWDNYKSHTGGFGPDRDHDREEALAAIAVASHQAMLRPAASATARRNQTQGLRPSSLAQ